MSKQNKKYKTVYTIIENEFQQIYVSHIEKHESQMNGGELIIDELFVCALPGEKVPVNYFKSDKKSPRLYIPKTICLL